MRPKLRAELEISGQSSSRLRIISTIEMNAKTCFTERDKWAPGKTESSIFQKGQEGVEGVGVKEKVPCGEKSRDNGSRISTGISKVSNGKVDCVRTDQSLVTECLASSARGTKGDRRERGKEGPNTVDFNGVCDPLKKTSEVCNSRGVALNINPETRMSSNPQQAQKQSKSELKLTQQETAKPKEPGVNSQKKPAASKEKGKDSKATESKTRFTKGTWKADEDKLLISLVGKFGPQNWTRIADYIPQRSGKQCRERWHNHLDPNINKKKWTTHEDMILIEAHKK